MNLPISPPPRPAGTLQQQIDALYRYLYKLVEQLNQGVK